MSDTLWDRAEKESNEAFEAFRAYRDLGQRRSITRAAETVGKSPQLLERWSARWKWVSRCRAFDGWLATLQDEQTTHARMEMNQRHARLGVTVLEKAGKLLDAIDVTKATAQDTATLMKLAVATERLARGLEPFTNASPDASTTSVSAVVGVGVILPEGMRPAWMPPEPITGVAGAGAGRVLDAGVSDSNGHALQAHPTHR